MAKLKKHEQEKISVFAKEKKIISFINQFLAENNMGDFEVTAMKFQPKKQKHPNPLQACGPGKHWEEVCTVNGGCKLVCVDN